MIEAVVLDLDGVLLESEARWDEARRALARAFGIRWPAGATAAMMGMSPAEWSRYMREAVGVPLRTEQINREVLRRLTDGYRASLPLIPGAVGAVRALAERWPLGLASSSNREVIDLLLEWAGLADRFTATVSSEEVARGKPAPDVYLEAAGRLGVDPARAVAVEDSANGIRSAHAAGMTVVAVPNRTFPPAREALHLAAAVVPTTADVTPALLRSLEGG